MDFRGHSRYAALVQPGMLIVPRVSMFSIKEGLMKSSTRSKH